MKKIMLLLIEIMLFYSSFSQSNYFNKYYNPNNTWAVNFNIYTTPDGYVSAGLMGDSVYYFKQNIVLSKFDSIGNLITFKEYKLDSSNYYVGPWAGGGFAKCINGGYILGGDIENGNFIANYLMRLNDNFDTIWTKTIKNDTIYSTISQCIETSDKGFILCGDKKVSASTFNVMLIKTDSLGNKIWNKIYNISGYNGSDIDKAWNVTETPDKGYLLGCYTYSVPTMGLYQGSGDGVVIKTDSMGTIQWTKNVGSPETDGSVTTRVCQDGNYLIATVYSYFTAEYNDYYRGKLRLMKLTPAGSVIWDKQYEPEITSLSAMKVVELANGDIVVGGTKYHQVSFYQGYYDSYLYKMKANGDSIWYREYSKATTDTNIYIENALYNFEPTPDGGFVACGEFFVNTQIPQSIWLFKTDSFGCLQSGCNIVGVEEIKPDIAELTVFPNPATTQATISYPQIKTQGQLQIYNILGQKVYEENLNKNATQTVIDTKEYKKGLYKLVLREKGEIRGYASLIITN